ncbi:MAG: hypothetical protein IT300_00045 [Dehalococcoidia bacterium]|nr:hypothetical protein [Dehalococcoidia bacterium]
MANSKYPTLQAALSVVDATSGRPVAALHPASLVVTDDAGRLELVDLSPTVSDRTPVAFSILLDTGGAMAPHVARAREVLQSVVSQLGPNDVVRIVKFNEGTDEQGTNWVRRDDPNLAAQIAGWQAGDGLSLVVQALIRSSEVAKQAPQGYDRHVTVAFLSVDGLRGEPGLVLDSIAQIPTVTFAFGFGTPPTDLEGLPFFLEDLASQRGGAYWPVDSPKYTGNGTKLLHEVMHSVWKLDFVADGLPDGRSHTLRVEVRDSLLRSGAIEASYSAGTLLDVSPLRIEGLAQSERVSGDRRLTITLGGEKQWSDWTIQLFKDCEPDRCAPSAETHSGSLDWRLIAGPLDQGEHRLFIRVKATESGREFSETHVLGFTRVGTGWNLWTPIAVLGLALLAVAVVVGFARRHRPSSQALAN